MTDIKSSHSGHQALPILLNWIESKMNCLRESELIQNTIEDMNHVKQLKENPN